MKGTYLNLGSKYCYVNKRVEILKQDQYRPFSVAEQVISIFSGVRGLLDDIAIGNIKKFEIGLLSFISEKHKDVIEGIEKVKKLDDAMEEKIKSIVTEYKGLFQA